MVTSVSSCIQVSRGRGIHEHVQSSFEQVRLGWMRSRAATLHLEWFCMLIGDGRGVFGARGTMQNGLSKQRSRANHG